MSINNNSSKWYLEGSLLTGNTIIIPIDKTPFVIGRNEDCDLSLITKTVSRRHGEFFKLKGRLHIRDLGSTNGIFVNDKIIKKDCELKNNDTVAFGELSFKVLYKAGEIEDISTGTVYFNIPMGSNDFISHYDLTRREEEIFYHLLQGKTTKRIADTLFISEGTAKNHILNIFKKTNVHSRFELLTLYNSFSSKR